MNYTSLTPEELLNLWYSNRNSSLSQMAADELLNRINRGELLLIPSEAFKEKFK